MMKRIIVCLSLGLLASCAAPLQQPNAAMLERYRSEDPAMTLETIRADRTIYASKCSGCHSLPLPTVHRPEAWPVIIDSMAVRSPLTTTERNAIERFIRHYPEPSDE